MCAVPGASYTKNHYRCSTDLLITWLIENWMTYLNSHCFYSWVYTCYDFMLLFRLLRHIICHKILVFQGRCNHTLQTRGEENGNWTEACVSVDFLLSCSSAAWILIKIFKTTNDRTFDCPIICTCIHKCYFVHWLTLPTMLDTIKLIC